MSRLVRAAGSISFFTLLSRIAGLVRDSLMVQVLGAGWVQGTFLLAWTLPNLMRRLLGEGALSASLVPAYARARRDDPAVARTLLAQVVGAVVAILTPLCAIVAVASLLVPAEWLPAPDDGGVPAMRLLLSLNAILFAYALPVCLTAVYAGALNTLGHFALPAAVPIVLNLFWIAALLVAKPLGFTVDVDVAHFAAWWLTVGGFLQLVLVVWPLWRRGELLRPPLGWPAKGTPARAVFVAMLPTVLGMSLNQISSLLDQLMAYYLVSPGAVTYVYLANRLLLFPHALTAMSVAVAVFPKLAHEAHDVDRTQMRRTLDLAAAATILVTVPAAVGLIVLGEDVVRVLFVRGKFGEADVGPTVWTTGCLVAGLPFLGLAQLYARAYYAIGDMKTPARLAAWLVLLNVALNAVLVTTTSLGTAALTLSSSLSALANAAFLAWGLRAHAPAAHDLGKAWLRTLLATAAMAAALPLCQFAAPDGSRMSKAMLDVAVPIVAGVVVYLAAHAAMRSPELTAVLARARKRGTPAK
ncbi:MAG: murein biosynthesis integral membrane protein MurJ [Planctomycetota bacterium]